MHRETQISPHVSYNTPWPQQNDLLWLFLFYSIAYDTII